jgi:hypothetical protein
LESAKTRHPRFNAIADVRSEIRTDTALARVISDAVATYLAENSWLGWRKIYLLGVESQGGYFWAFFASFFVTASLRSTPKAMLNKYRQNDPSGC